MTLVWGFDDGADPYATAILERMPELQAHVPPLWPLVVANALLVGQARCCITPAENLRFLVILATFPITVDDETVVHVWLETMHLAASTEGLSSYDAAYLEPAACGAGCRWWPWTASSRQPHRPSVCRSSKWPDSSRPVGA